MGKNVLRRHTECSMVKKVEILPYNPDWPRWYIQILNFLRRGLPDAQIEHVGSTSVPGLVAKPVIDIDIVAKDQQQSDLYSAALLGLGYRHLGDLGISDREAFRLKAQKEKLPKHNLYVCLEDGLGLKNHLLLRDYLRNNPEVAIQYGNLKKELAIKFPFNVDQYCEGKTAFITDILLQEGIDRKLIDQITKENEYQGPD